MDYDTALSWRGGRSDFAVLALAKRRVQKATPVASIPGLRRLSPGRWKSSLRRLKAAYAGSQQALVSAQAEAADAKARLAVYGTSQVIAALARFEETGARLDSPRAHDLFAALVSAMRQKSRAAKADDLKLVLFGSSKERG